MTKKLTKISISVFLVLSLLAFMMLFTQCSKEEAAEPAPAPAPEPAEEPEVRSDDTQADYEDGIYFAQEDGFSSSGWKYMVTLEVEDGEIVSADWNGANVNAGLDKKTTDKLGMYGMVAKGGAQAEWYEQAEKAEAYLLETQDPTAITYSDDEGHTDDISGVSIHVVEFFDLAEKALAQGPVGRGPYEDGRYFAQELTYPSSGWKYTADLTVVTGRIVAAEWDGVNKDGDSKTVASQEGEYGMVENGGAQAPWFEQAAAAEAYLMETQDPTAVTYTDDSGHTDDISGVTIHVGEFFDLAEKALEKGPVGPAPYIDGKYTAEADEFSDSGWKSKIEIVVSDGFITDVNWDAVNEDGASKKAQSESGEYGMVENGGAQAEWHEQAILMEQTLLETQDPAAISMTDGYPDDVAGVSIHVTDFVDLAAEALEEAKK